MDPVAAPIAMPVVAPVESPPLPLFEDGGSDAAPEVVGLDVGVIDGLFD